MRIFILLFLCFLSSCQFDSYNYLNGNYSGRITQNNKEYGLNIDFSRKKYNAYIYDTTHTILLVDKIKGSYKLNGEILVFESNIHNKRDTLTINGSYIIIHDVESIYFWQEEEDNYQEAFLNKQ